MSAAVGQCAIKENLSSMLKHLSRAVPLLALCAFASAGHAHAQGRLYMRFFDATGKNKDYYLKVWRANRSTGPEANWKMVPANTTEWTNIFNFLDDVAFTTKGQEYRLWDGYLQFGPGAKYVIEMKHKNGATMAFFDLDVFLFDGSAFKYNKQAVWREGVPEILIGRADTCFGASGSLYIEFYYPWAQDQSSYAKQWNSNKGAQPVGPTIAQVTTTDRQAALAARRVPGPETKLGSVMYEDRVLRRPGVAHPALEPGPQGQFVLLLR